MRLKGSGIYVTFCGETGERLAWLHPIDAVGVNGVHALVIAASFVRVEIFRRGHTYDLLITRHAPGVGENGRRPPLESKVLFRALEGYVALDLAKEHKDRRGSVIPTFYSRAGEAIAVPVQFEAVLKAVVSGANCIACSHSHYLRPLLKEEGGGGAQP